MIPYFKKQLIKLIAAILLILCGMSSCTQDLFNPDLVKRTYEDAFPVKSIDPQLDWKTTRPITADVTVFGVEGKGYTIRVYDTNPIEHPSEARLLMQGSTTSANRLLSRFDCPTFLTELFISCNDETNRALVQLSAITNERIIATFGEEPETEPEARTGDAPTWKGLSTNGVSTRTAGFPDAATRATNNGIEALSPTLSEEEVLTLAAGAKEVKANSTLKAGEVWKISEGKIFRNDIETWGSSDNNPATLIIQGTWRPGGNIAAIQSGTRIFVTSTGRIELPDTDKTGNRNLTLIGNSYLTVYPGGYIGGEEGAQEGYIYVTNGSAGNVNYNAGTIRVKYICMDGAQSRLYNSGTLDIERLIFNNEGSKLTNMGHATIGTTSVNSTIENGCYLHVTDNLCGHLFMGNSCAALIASYGAVGDNSGKIFRLGDHSMITIEKDAWLAYGMEVQGPDRGEALFKIGVLKSINGFRHTGGTVFYEVQKESVSDWEKKTFLHYMMNTKGTLARWGESPITIPEGECTGEGNIPESSGDPLPENPLSFSYVFEDNFPMVGDYDFNDVVIDVTPIYHRDPKSNCIQRIQLNVTLTAAGSSKPISLGLRLAGIEKNQIASIQSVGEESRHFIESMSHPNNQFSFNSATLMEDSDPSIVLPIAGEVHKVFGVQGYSLVNTGEGPEMKPYTYGLLFELADQTQTTPLFSKENLDFFICYNYKGMSKRMEVHLYEFWNLGATASGTIQKLNLDVAGNNTWAVSVPYGFHYPKEYINISRTGTLEESAYPDFIKWARNRNVCQDWYLRPNEPYVMRKAAHGTDWSK